MLFTLLLSYCRFALFALAFFIFIFQGKAQKAGTGLFSGKSVGQDTATINSLNQKAQKQISRNLDSALATALLAEQASLQTSYTLGRANALMTLTAIYQNKGAYTKATTNGLTAVSLYEDLHNEAATAAAYLSLAQVYKDMSGQERTTEYNASAIAYSARAYNLYSDITDTAGIINSLSLWGTLYRDKAKRQHTDVLNDTSLASKLYDTSLTAFKKAIRLMVNSGKGKEYGSKLYNNISQVYIEQKKDYPIALMYLFQAVAINEKNNNIVSLSHNYGNISEAYLQSGRKDLSLLYAKKMMAAATQTGRPNRMVNGMLQMSRSYEAVGRLDSALFYYTKATDLDDSLNSIAVTQQVDELQTKYETEKNETSIRLLHAENEVKSSRIIWLVVGLVLIGALAIGLIALYRRVQHQKVLLTAQATRLEVMMKELHHRVKNNLQIVSSLLNMQTYKLQDEESISALKTSGERVQAMSLIHQRLYSKDELTAVNLKEYITDLAESLMQSYGYSHQNFELQVQVEQELMDVDTALPIGLIVNELITNSLKYAYAKVEHPTLHISLTDQGSSIRLSVKDNGQDFSLAKWQQGKGSFGKQLIVSLCRQLRAKQTVDTSNGTEFVINIPLKAA